MSITRRVLTLILIPVFVILSPGAMGNEILGLTMTHACCTQPTKEDVTVHSCCSVVEASETEEVACNGGCGSCVTPAIAFFFPSVVEQASFLPTSEVFIPMETRLNSRAERPEAPPPKAA